MVDLLEPLTAKMELLCLVRLAIATVYVRQGRVIRVRIVQLPMHVPKRQMEDPSQLIV